jgi:hypothetical protein
MLDGYCVLCREKKDCVSNDTALKEQWNVGRLLCSVLREERLRE